MHRKPLLSLLLSYKNKHPKETETVQSFIGFVQKNPHCFERTLSIGHVTGSAWLVNANRSKILLTHHRKLNKWLQLGGHADGQTDILSVTKREAHEESGLAQIIVLSKDIFDIDIHHIPENRHEAEHFHYDVRFILQAQGSEKLNISDESHDLSWVAIPSLHETTDEESILRMRQKWLSRNATS